MEKAFESLEKYLVYALIIVLPVVVFPGFVNIHYPAKAYILVSIVLIVTLLKVVKLLFRGNLEMTTGKYDWVVLGLALSYLLSTYFTKVNKIEALFIPGITTALVSAALVYFLVLQLKNKFQIRKILIVSASVVGFTTLLQISKIFGQIPQMPAIFKNDEFSFIGGYIPTLVYLASIFPLAIIETIQEKEAVTKVVNGIACVLISFGIFASVFNIVSQKKTTPQTLDFSTSWTIAADAVKESPAFGVGPSNYIVAFNKFRPASYNNQSFWATKFTAAANQPLTMLTEVGLIGFALFVSLILLVVKNLPKGVHEYLVKPEYLSLLVLLVLSMIFPLTIVGIFLLFVLLGAASTSHRFKLPLVPQNLPTNSLSYRIPFLIVVLPILAVTIYGLFYFTKLTYAEQLYANSLRALSNKDGGKQAYETINKAIKLNPKSDKYHATLSQIDIALISLVAKKGNDQITDADREFASKAFDEAITQAKISTSLNPQKAQNWEFLANTYQTLRPFNKNVDQFAAVAYSQAIVLDPVNPLTRIALGGIYYSRGDFETAADIFKLAVAVKPDYANSHYNLAVAYRESNNIPKAIESMKTVLTLVKSGSKDHELAQAELKALESRKANPVSSNSTQPEELTQPSPSPTPAINPELELPENAAPSVVPSPTPLP